MEDELIYLLSTFGYPVKRQGSLSDQDNYPDHFFTFWNNDSDDHSHYDNSEYGTSWDFDINFYSIDPEKAYSILDSARDLLKSHGWIISGKGRDVMSDEPTHTGRGMEALYLQV